MPDKEQAIAKVKEIANNIQPLVAAFTKLTGKKDFTLSQIVPGWDKLDDKFKELLGLEFKDHVAKSGEAGIVDAGKTSDGVDMYTLKK